MNKNSVVPLPSPESLLSFSPVNKCLKDVVSVPKGYTYNVLYALGDPLTESTPAYKNDGNDTDFENRAGDHHDGMEWFGLSATGAPSATSSERGLLAMNHEATTTDRSDRQNIKLPSLFLHTDGGTTTLPRPDCEVEKEIAAHGISVVEIRKNGTHWETVPASSFNRRITPLTEVEISGPVRGKPFVITKFSPDGTKIRGTLGNCGTGRTPWNTYLSGEENWAGYYTRAAGDDAARNDKSVVSLNRYGRRKDRPSRHGWETAGSEKYTHFNISKTGTSTDGSDDYRNELNGMGYIVELDPYCKATPAKKRTALGRAAHESAAFSTPVPGQPLAVYMGDDSENEYIFKFVSTANWDAADANATNSIAIGDKYLDCGKLYVAKFAAEGAEGTGEWIELNINNPAITAFTTYPFACQADVLVNARLAGDAVGATKMDRPEWCAVNPANGEVYYALTNNSNRVVEPRSLPQLAPDSANPRAYTDEKGKPDQKGKTVQAGNLNGHILRLKESTDGSVATSFTWDVYLFGAETEADKSKINLSKLTADQDFSSPDGLAFVKSTGICWIQTDDDSYTDVTNCMMLAALPGQVGDGAKTTLSHDRLLGAALAVDTFVGKTPTHDTLKRFLVGPVACELTGVTETPDGKTLFVNIQHPGETTLQADIADPNKYTSHWPRNYGFGAGDRPRSATIVITKDDGGRIGS
jgi:hypothetical protein